MTDAIRLEKKDHVSVLTLNRPERHNAISGQMLADLRAAVLEFTEDGDQRVLIITGAGDKAFCSGADLKDMDRDTQGAGARKSIKDLPIAKAPDLAGIGACPKPVIAAINGLAVGGGMEITLCCDIRIASDNAWFALPEVKRGFLAGVAAVVLPRLLPTGAVMDLMLTGERLAVADAYRLGLVQTVTSQEALMDEAMRKAGLMSAMSQPALWATKASVRYWRDLQLTEQYRHYELVTHRALLSGDMFEGLKAFAEKREPVYGDGWPDPYREAESDKIVDRAVRP